MSRSRHGYRRYEGEKLYHLEKTLAKYRLKMPLAKVIAEYDATMEVIERYEEVARKVDAA